ncbi:MAG: hypothetical protein U1F43_23345 [Myxococcota bacterium]
MTIAGHNVTSAVATFGRIKINLKGSINDKGLLNLAGRIDNSFLRVHGTADKGGSSFSGTWDGTVDKKRSAASSS